jgi:hypothetical protein
MPTDVTVIYHYEDAGWWAYSPDIDRWSAAASELPELVGLVEEGVPFALDTDDVAIRHQPAPDLLDVFSGRSAGVRLRVRIAETFRGLLSSDAEVAVPEELMSVASAS